MSTLGQLQSVISARAMQDSLTLPDGRPDAAAIAEKIGCSRHTVQRILRNRVARAETFRPSPAFVRGLQRWFALGSEADVWSLLQRTDTRPLGG